MLTVYRQSILAESETNRDQLKPITVVHVGGASRCPLFHYSHNIEIDQSGPIDLCRVWASLAMSHKHILSTIAALVCLGALVYFQIRQWRSFDWNRFQQASHVHRHIAIAIGLVHLTSKLRTVAGAPFCGFVRHGTGESSLPPV